MSAALVIDSYVSFAWYIQHNRQQGRKKLLQQVESGATVVVPELWRFEMANGLLVLQRRKKLTAAERKQALATLESLNLTEDTEGAKAAFAKTSELADKHGLSVYDACYLELALRRRLPLASRDRSLVRAAKTEGLNTL